MKATSDMTKKLPPPAIPQPIPTPQVSGSMKTSAPAGAAMVQRAAMIGKDKTIFFIFCFWVLFSDLSVFDACQSKSVKNAILFSFLDSNKLILS